MLATATLWCGELDRSGPWATEIPSVHIRHLVMPGGIVFAVFEFGRSLREETRTEVCRGRRQSSAAVDRDWVLDAVDAQEVSRDRAGAMPRAR
jgi:hypothetical protein